MDNLPKQYAHDVFCNTRSLSLEMKKQIINETIKISTEWWVDILDCKTSFARKRIDMSLEDIMKKFDDSSHFSIIHRRGYEDPWYGEIAFRSWEPNEPDYFLWIKITENDLNRLIKKYNLEP